MANKTPFIVYGTIRDEDSALVTNTVVTVHDTTLVQRITYITGSDGRYLLDLANLEGDYATGDSITVYVRNNGYWAETTFTLSGEGGVEKNLSTNNQVTVSNFRVKGWYVFLKALQSGTFAVTMTDINGASVSNSTNILGAYNDKITSDLGYPLVIIYPPVIGRSGITLQNAQQDNTVNFLIEIYHVASRNCKTLTDDVENQIWRAQEVWSGIHLNGLDMPTGDYDIWNEGDKKIHRMSLNTNFMFDGVVSIP